MKEQEFIQAGYTVAGTEGGENKLLNFLKEHYPSVIKDNEINLNELKAIAGLPIDEKVNGYGLNFVGRNFARGKYYQKTEKELRLNAAMSKNIDTTQNLVLKGDNLDSLKILKNYYKGQIKCIYIDPPYNTANDEFVYPDKFDKEEAEVLGLVNLSESDFARMDFSFKTKKSYNGWLAFMYPRLLLARDLLSKDGVIFISIDDNEQANLKLLCDDVFGEENFAGQISVVNNPRGRDYGGIAQMHEYLLVYQGSQEAVLNDLSNPNKEFLFSDSNGGFELRELRNRNIAFNKENRPNLYYPFYINPNKKLDNELLEISLEPTKDSVELYPKESQGYKTVWRWGKEKSKENINKEIAAKRMSDGGYMIVEKYRKSSKMARSVWADKEDNSEKGTLLVKELFEGKKYFDFPKSVEMISKIVEMGSNQNDIILDFFAGSGTTAHAVMQLNAEDGGNRKFILCQIDEPIQKDKPAYKFCVENNLPPVISSITIERLKRAGEKIAKELEDENSKPDLFDGKRQVPDIGFKVFDSVIAPKLEADDKGQISISFNESDALSRIYNMIFTVGLDEPTQVPEVVVKDSIYKIGKHYYITNSEKITSDDYSNAIKNGKVFIDGWTASLNGTLQNYKEDVKIVF
ncbi:MAG TPA: site-specific DNA-methyltransferase [Spirochaetota bacterium]|nr:site-specific DNA-methyltransferase [Spirochaetota bacterium]